jgi:hypothetical protein
MKPETFHDGKAGAVDHGKVLVRERLPDGPCTFEVGCRYRFDRCYAPPEALPETLRRLTVNTVAQQEPALDKDVVGRD